MTIRLIRTFSFHSKFHDLLGAEELACSSSRMNCTSQQVVCSHFYQQNHISVINTKHAPAQGMVFDRGKNAICLVPHSSNWARNNLD